jgi:hypothetical protein
LALKFWGRAKASAWRSDIVATTKGYLNGRNNVRGETSMVKKVEIKKTELDEDFRQKVKELLDSAKRDVVIITGEGAAFGYLDLRWATERAVERGVKIKIYATNPVPEFLNKVLMLGCKVYRGERKAGDHFLVVDGKHWVVSREHPPQVTGGRHGEVHLNDRKGAKKILAEFDCLIKSARQVRTPMWNEDPLVKAIRHPKDWGIKTDSRKIDDELFG